MFVDPLKALRQSNLLKEYGKGSSRFQNIRGSVSEIVKPDQSLVDSLVRDRSGEKVHMSSGAAYKYSKNCGKMYLPKLIKPQVEDKMAKFLSRQRTNNEYLETSQRY
jgi:hypothetical protein